MSDLDVLERNPRLADLLTAHVTVGLEPQEHRELRSLLEQHPDLEMNELLRAAALLDVTFMSEKTEREELPPELRLRVLAQGEQFTRTIARPRHSARVASSRLGWWIAAAALLALGIQLFPVLTPEPTLSVARQDLMGDTDSIIWQWAKTTDRFGDVRGDVVWSPGQQRGYLRFSDLPKLDPSREQYQLWIVDDARKRKHPVDGGVFDHPGTVEPDAPVIVEFRAKLPVFAANAFAITVESPGGVVVSDGPLEIVAARPE